LEKHTGFPRFQGLLRLPVAFGQGGLVIGTLVRSDSEGTLPLQDGPAEIARQWWA
jgi:hypothetical protein